MFFVLLGCLAVFFPIGIYSLFVARLNNRTHPVFVWGVWDFLGVLFALSGLLLYVGPCLLTSFNSPWRDVWLQINYRSLRGYDNSVPVFWPGLRSGLLLWNSAWYLYFFLIGSGAALLLWHRRNVTAIYNVEPALLADTLRQTLDRLGYQWERIGSQFQIDERSLADVAASGSNKSARVMAGVGRAGSESILPLAEAAPAIPKFGKRPTNLTLSKFSAMRHVTLRWQHAEAGVREQVESELANALQHAPSRRSWVALWLRSFAAVLFLALFFLTAYVQIIRMQAADPF